MEASTWLQIDRWIHHCRPRLQTRHSGKMRVFQGLERKSPDQLCEGGRSYGWEFPPGYHYSEKTRPCPQLALKGQSNAVTILTKYGGLAITEGSVNQGLLLPQIRELQQPENMALIRP